MNVFKTTSSNRSKVSMNEKLEIISSRKRNGDVTKVAKMTGFTTGYVSQVLNMKFQNSRIINAAYSITRYRKQNSKKTTSL
jgi:hypothetical protein